MVYRNRERGMIGAIIMTVRNASSQDPEHLPELLIVREHARADAWAQERPAALEALLAPDFVEINSFGRFRKGECSTGFFRLLPCMNLLWKSGLSANSQKIPRSSLPVSRSVHGEREKNEGTFSVTATYTINNNQYRLAVWQISPAS